MAALLFFSLGLLGNLHKSLTWDEPVFIASGYSFLKKNDFRLNPEAPPLMQILTAVPLLALDLEFPDEDDPSWSEAYQFSFARKFLLINPHKIMPITFVARLPTLLLGAVLVVLVGMWGRGMYGHCPLCWPCPWQHSPPTFWLMPKWQQPIWDAARLCLERYFSSGKLCSPTGWEHGRFA